MQKAIIVAIIGLIGSVLAALITAHGTTKAQIAEERQRMSGGAISAEGQTETSIGRAFTVSRDSSNNRTRITFDPPAFARPPIVLVTPHAVAEKIFIPRIISIDNRSVVLDTLEWHTGASLPCRFSFTVLEGTE